MINKIKDLFPKPEEKVTWISIAVCGKFLVVLLLYFNLELHHTPYPFLYGGDGPMYLQVTENIKNFGVYALYGTSPLNLEPYTGRMPGYEMVLVLFRSFLSRSHTLYAVVITQLLLAALSTYYLALIGKTVFKSNLIFYTVFFLYLANTYITILDISSMTESFAISSFIIAFYLLIRPKSHNKAIDYLISGAFFTWAVFLRQYLAPFSLLFVLFIIYKSLSQQKQTIKHTFVLCLLLLLPFIVADAVWVARNYNAKGKFIPLVDDLHAGYNYSERYKKLMIFIQSWGGDLIHWNPKAEIIFFIPDITANMNPQYNNVTDLPTYIYTSQYNQDSLIKLQKYYSLLESKQLDKKDSERYDKWVTESLDKYTASFKSEKPLHYYFYAPIQLFTKFFLHSGTYNISNRPFHEQNLPQTSVKLFYTALYFLVVFGGFTGILLNLRRIRAISPEKILIMVAAVYMLFLCPFVLRRIEYRYFALCYPFLLLFLSHLIYLVSLKLNLHKFLKTSVSLIPLKFKTIIKLRNQA